MLGNPRTPSLPRVSTSTLGKGKVDSVYIVYTSNSGLNKDKGKVEEA
jgi:hypothetical protein